MIPVSTDRGCMPPNHAVLVTRHTAYIDALVDHTLNRDDGARSAWIRASSRALKAGQTPLSDDEWPIYRDAYERKYGDCCTSYRALDILRAAGAL